MVAKKIKLLVIVGPTASGKTALSIKVAKKYDGEIISADSRAIYKYLDIGTAKPTKAEQDGTAHWGFDLAGPGQDYNVADFKKYADDKIGDIRKRHKLPLLVGGSGLYIDAVIYDFSLAPKNELLREQMAGFSISNLQETIHKLQLKMPANYNNRRHLIRVIERGKQPLTKKVLPQDALIIGICPDRQELDNRIKLRSQIMIKEGVIKEIMDCSKRYGWDSTAMTGGIYRAFRGFIDDKLSLEEAQAMSVKSDRLLAKRQITWFKRNKDIHWFGNTSEALVWLDGQIGGKL